ncbi:MAG: Rossmann-like and DUF2520 domain-containing protein [Planctomycetota bacterium]|jgi:predicted short-subunit dehydrogenase-like oxidoreductase (DUF2520 family)
MEKGSHTVAILGVGPAGRALGGAFVDSGFAVVSAYSRSCERAEKALEAMEAPNAAGTDDPAEAARLANLVVFAVPDKAIADLAGEVASAGGFKTGGIAIHLSGSQPSSVLEPAHLQGAKIASLHPVKSFVGSAEDRDFTGVCVGLEGEDEAVEDLEKIIKQLGAIPLKLRTEDKAIYHLASSVVSNFTVSLFHQGLKLLETIGVPRKVALPALTSLLRGTVSNISTLGVPKALSGPIARGDSETVASHMEALKERASERLPLYAALARYTVEVALEKGTLPVEEAEVLKSMLARYT